MQQTKEDKSLKIHKIIPLMMMGICLLVHLYMGHYGLSYWGYTLLSGVFLIIGITDWYYNDVYDDHILVGFSILLIFRFIEGWPYFYMTIINTLISVLSMLTMYYFVMIAVALFNIKRIKEFGEGLGSGDVTFSILFGATIGLEHLMYGFVILPLLVGSYLIITRQSHKTVIAAVPFIIISGLISLINFHG